MAGETTLREEKIKDAILAAREIQEFLWEEMNQGSGLEEWKRILWKRMDKIEKLDTANPHYKIELKKRVLRMAACSISLLEQMEKRNIDDGVHPNLESNLPQYENRVIPNKG